MFDFDWSKLALLGILALIFIPPKDLPRVLRQVGQMVGKMRRMATEFQGQFADAIKDADMASLKEDLAKLKQSATLDVNLHASPSASADIPSMENHASASLAPVAALELPAVPDVPAQMIAAPAKADAPKLRVRRKPAKTASMGAGTAARPSRRRAAKEVPSEESKA